jgi:acetyl esterase/lipase
MSHRWFPLAAILLACQIVTGLDDAQQRRNTFTYKQVGDLQLRADVYRPAGNATRIPVVVNIHGGALMKMDRSSLSETAKLLAERGFIVVSPDYRLGPETTLPGIIRDVVDACAWVRREGPGLFGADAGRLAVVGASAGGYLALAAGYQVDPKPDVVVSEFGFCELIGNWATRPSPDPEHWETKMSREEAERLPLGKPVANASERPFNILPYYNYFRQNGLWPKMLTGWDPVREKEKYLPYMPLYNVTPAYPPTILVHGTRDPDVPVEQSRLMADQFRKHGVKHETVFVEGAEHGLRGVDAAQVQAAYRSAAEFVARQLAAPAAKDR